jgi:hypothetical protein
MMGRRGIELSIVCLRFFFAAERQIGEDNVKPLRRLLKLPAVALSARQRVAMPKVWLVDAV